MADFWADVHHLLGNRVIRGISAQRDGEAILKAALQSLSEHVGYRPGLFPRGTKSMGRLLEKCKALLSADPGSRPEATVQKITDIAGSRILVIGVGDIRLALDFVCTIVSGPACKTLSEPEYSIEQAKPAGWRGAKRILGIRMTDGEFFPFELQVMTFLQHTWDQLQHRLYEIARSGGKSSEGLAEEFLELSDRLYLIDGKLDALKIKLNV